MAATPAVIFAKGFLAASGGRDLAKRLETCFSTLKSIEQDDAGPPAGLDNIAAGLVAPALLRSKVREVSLLTCCCLADVLRLYAPDAPYSDEQKLVRGGGLI
jgi:sister-chromatid-cohesion protein PDS5